MTLFAAAVSYVCACAVWCVLYGTSGRKTAASFSGAELETTAVDGHFGGLSTSCGSPVLFCLFPLICSVATNRVYPPWLWSFWGALNSYKDTPI
jgi:hypothetical protein